MRLAHSGQTRLLLLILITRCKENSWGCWKHIQGCCFPNKCCGTLLRQILCSHFMHIPITSVQPMLKCMERAGLLIEGLRRVNIYWIWCPVDFQNKSLKCVWIWISHPFPFLRPAFYSERWKWTRLGLKCWQHSERHKCRFSNLQ